MSGELTVCKGPAKLKLPWYSKTFFKVGRSVIVIPTAKLIVYDMRSQT